MIKNRTRVGNLIIITANTNTSVYKLREWNMLYMHARPLFEGSQAECKEFAKYHEGLW